ncbi:MAG: endonuclease domain-containing protein [Thermoanaerobaculia bacterium]|nr:endonuclease domain-containing protein [Thermoanaerobaculia bacterium]
MLRIEAPEGVRSIAKEMRRRSTLAEQALWQLLRGRRHLGLKFRRQAPVGRFVVDFLCHSRRLVVEVDGGIHLGKSAEDAARTLELEGLGFRVIRFTNEVVLHQPELVLRDIETAARR